MLNTVVIFSILVGGLFLALWGTEKILNLIIKSIYNKG
jgi:predicted DNA repair protein MutK